MCLVPIKKNRRYIVSLDTQSGLRRRRINDVSVIISCLHIYWIYTVEFNFDISLASVYTGFMFHLLGLLLSFLVLKATELILVLSCFDIYWVNL